MSGSGTEDSSGSARAAGSFGAVPVIDFGPYLDERTSEADRAKLRARLAAELRAACQDVGFYFLAGAEKLVPEALIRETFLVTAQFHNLDLAEKMAFDVRRSKLQTGYMPNYGDVANPANTVEKGESALKLMTSKSSYNEAFMVAGGRGLGKQSFPDAQLPAMRPVLGRYDAAMQALATKMLPVYAEALGLPAAALLEKFEKPLYSYRFTHYPETPVGPSSGQGRMYGIQPHADVDFFTILAQNDIPGLSLRLPSGEWVAVPALPQTFLINTGEILHRLSNGRFRNTVHRVENRSGQERYAVVCFLNLDRHAVLDPVVEPGTRPRWPRFSAQDVFKEMVRNPVGLYQEDDAEKPPAPAKL